MIYVDYVILRGFQSEDWFNSWQPHSDNGAITILMQNDVPGLQVLNKGEWFTVIPIRGALVVNIGDMLQVLG